MLCFLDDHRVTGPRLREVAVPFLTVVPEFVGQVAGQLETIGSALREANMAAAGPTTGVLAAGADEVSAAATSLFAGYAQAYQALSAEMSAFHARFMQAVNQAGLAYASAEAANVSPLQSVEHAASGVQWFSRITVPSAAPANGTRITVPGNAPSNNPILHALTGSLTPQQYAALNAEIGENWLPGTTPEVVNYPATLGVLNGLTAPTGDQALATGQQMLNIAILNATRSGQSVVVTGVSEGTIVIDHEEAYLASAPNAPSPNQVTFVEFANAQRGLADTFFHPGTTIPGLGYTVTNTPVSQYNTTLVYSQYDGFADPPDRPWNLLADVNALAGIDYLHTATEFASPSQVVEVSSVTNTLGGTTTTYMIPTTTLPLLMPLQQIGVPAPIVGALNSALTPIVNAGYSQYDPTGGPYFSQGNLLW
jgi:hypothetical protein